jgi:phosphatidylglycerophosphate synthase
MAEPSLTRRPIAAREMGWARRIAGWLARRKIRPNSISVFSVFCAALAGACLWLSRDDIRPQSYWLLFGAALFIQSRLLCNLFDGMVAVEGGLKSKSGEIYNEFPDRIADAIIIVAAGYASPSAFGSLLGWSAALLAVITAYIRTLGAAAGAGQEFCGPMAKQQRMFLITIASLLTMWELAMGWEKRSITWALLLIVLGCVLTIFRRASRIIAKLEGA